MEPIESSETSAYNNTLTPGTYPKEKKLQLSFTLCKFTQLPARPKFSVHHIHSSFIVCLTRLEPFSKPILHRVRSSASCLRFQYYLVSLRSFSSCFLLLPRLSVTFIALFLNNLILYYFLPKDKIGRI